MTSYISKKVARHILQENSKNHFGTEDPYFDYITEPDRNGKPGKVKKTKKAIPPGLTNAEAKILKKVTRRAHTLDKCFSLCGIRIGWGAIFGIIPGLGDVFDAFMAMMVYRTCCQADLPSAVRTRMMINIMLDFAIGLVPFIGDVADALYKCNTRNASLLYSHLRERGEKRIKGGDATGLLEDRKHSVGRGAKNEQPITSPTAGSTPSSQPHPPVSDGHHYTPGQVSGTITRGVSEEPEIRSPGYAKTKDGNKGGWLSRLAGTGGVASKREPDLEAGEGTI